MRIILLTLFILFNCFSGYSQREKARQLISILASDSLAGRGYVENGQAKASDFISNELTNNGVSSIQQHLTYSVNTFPGNIQFNVFSENDEIAYQPGVDFLIHPASGSVKFKKKTIIQLTVDEIEGISSRLKSKSVYTIERDQENSAKINEFITEFLEKPTFKSSLLIVQDTGKLTWFPSQTQSVNAVILLRPELKSKQINAHWKAELKRQFSSANILAKISGKRSDSVVMFSAHYDHLGKMGDEAIFPGAHDNASGVAMLLTLSEYFADHTPEFDTYFLFTTGEELGLLGSYYFVQNPLFDLSKIKLLINLDLLGTGEEGIMVVNAKKHKKIYEQMKTLNAHHLIPEIKARGEACNSDHCLFDKSGVPAIYIYTLGGRKAYHDVEDKAEGLSLYGYDAIQQLIIDLCFQL
ncbi:M28 family peptidase [Marivirga sp. S37H4]|uniref:M28 family peptidase n=1 Tax=Marivirga aurantiaca TaxID=2802615 RepID=A0A935C966_9BACT|nr:M28 family peptidase [Marivirga aurantiaca]MBK6265824.1 M28 family peptidase [Marivirga aurantiaca]